MSQENHRRVLQQPIEQALEQIALNLAQHNLYMVRSFDLQSARGALGDCSCPYHGTSLCDCQYVVLLIYGPVAEPATLVLHGRSDQTWLCMVDTPAQHPEPGLKEAIMQAVAV